MCPASDSSSRQPFGTTTALRLGYELEGFGYDRREGIEMSNRHSGSCLCGAVRFEIEGEFERFYLCHCGYCRKDTGSAHAANLFSSAAALRWISGSDNVRQFNLPATRHAKAFCSTCGSALPLLQMNGKLLMVPAGSLTSKLSIRPTAHIFASSKASWDCELESITVIDSFPAD